MCVTSAGCPESTPSALMYACHMRVFMSLSKDDGSTGASDACEACMPCAAQVRHPGGLPFAVLMACLIVAMGVVYLTQQASPARKGRQGRSTDRVD